MIAGWHEQIRWPRDLATQMIKYGGSSFGDAVIASASWRHTGESGTEPITAITQATNAINAAYPTFKLAQVEIITEDEHDNGYRTDNENAVVLVLPNKERVKDTNDSASLLNSAKLLMACTPNGI